MAGAFGAVLATWVTFVPSFLWIFLGAPHVEQLRDRRSIAAALTTVTAAVVAVVLNLAVWFTTYTLFAVVEVRRGYGAVFHQPDLASLDVAALVIVVGALVAVFVVRLPTVRLVVCAAAVGVLHQFLLA